jgi:hypothetical protein
VYITVARYAGVTYPAEQPFQLVDQGTYQADIPIYDTTTADDGIRLERLNLLIVGADQGMLQFMEMGSLVNTSDRTFVTSNPEDQALAHAIRFALPQGALGVQMQAGFRDEDMIAGIGGVQVTSPVPPGRHEFALSFQLPYTGSSVDVSVQVPYPTAAFNVYVPDSGPRLQSGRLVQGDRADLGGQSYVQYSATNLPRSTLMDGQIVGLGAAPGLLRPAQLGFLSLGVVVFVLGAGALVLRSRPRGVEHERLALVQQLASLDDRFARGELDEQDYKVEREEGKRRLVALTLAQRGQHSN